MLVHMATSLSYLGCKYEWVLRYQHKLWQCILLVFRINALVITIAKVKKRINIYGCAFFFIPIKGIVIFKLAV